MTRATHHIRSPELSARTRATSPAPPVAQRPLGSGRNERFPTLKLQLCGAGWRGEKEEATLSFFLSPMTFVLHPSGKVPHAVFKYSPDTLGDGWGPEPYRFLLYVLVCCDSVCVCARVCLRTCAPLEQEVAETEREETAILSLVKCLTLRRGFTRAWKHVFSAQQRSRMDKRSGLKLLRSGTRQQFSRSVFIVCPFLFSLTPPYPSLPTSAL